MMFITGVYYNEQSNYCRRRGSRYDGCHFCVLKRGKRSAFLKRTKNLAKKAVFLFTGEKDRCNITNACPADEFLTHVVTNPRFLYSTFSQFNNEDMMDYLEEIGLPIKTERGQRVFSTVRPVFGCN